MSDRNQEPERLTMLGRAKELAAFIEGESQPERWELAELCYDLVDNDGMKPGKLAKELGYTVEYVRQLRRTHEKYGDDANRDLGPDAGFRDYRMAAIAKTPTAVKAKLKAKADPEPTPSAETNARVVRVVREVVTLLEQQNYRKAMDSLRALAEELSAAAKEVAA